MKLQKWDATQPITKSFMRRSTATLPLSKQAKNVHKKTTVYFGKTTVVFKKTLDVFEKTLDVFGKTLDVFGKTLDVFEKSLPRVVFGMLGTPEEIPAVIVDIKYVFSRL